MSPEQTQPIYNSTISTKKSNKALWIVVILVILSICCVCGGLLTAVAIPGILAAQKEARIQNCIARSTAPTSDQARTICEEQENNMGQ